MTSCTFTWTTPPEPVTTLHFLFIPHQDCFVFCEFCLWSWRPFDFPKFKPEFSILCVRLDEECTLWAVCPLRNLRFHPSVISGSRQWRRNKTGCNFRRRSNCQPCKVGGASGIEPMWRLSRSNGRWRTSLHPTFWFHVFIPRHISLLSL